MLSGGNKTISRVPIQATYEGTALKPDGSNKKFTNVYTYHDFRSSVDRDDVFQVN